ncbi:dTDP-4-dehydrorhamnose reductase [Legionella impletisoli]|uniref:dTDP-4-dehydrorhamnose reductase n=1 Tax=Legionella impletisoli TaxID=343510 RepID=A0A917NA45_9GAMM|nr:dTDP-4-dehydrorhamnose reductase [Legionella impletisoli]GGI82018.1 dTDP-4-dehydrorhamnose reductase [Legionella impletisoli]
MDRKILLTGKNGQVGFELQRALKPLGEVIAVGSKDCDFANSNAVKNLIRQLKPDIIINPAAYTAVDDAEINKQLAFSINADALRVLGLESEKIGACVIHFSTDYVFDGTKQDPYVEQDKPNPLNIYGLSKLEGEEALLSSCSTSLILRTSWVFGVHGSNFAKKILSLAQQREKLYLVANQVGSPTSACLLADVTAHLLKSYLDFGKENFPFGLYHVVSEGYTSWYEYGKFVVEEGLKSGKKLTLQPSCILPISSHEYPTKATRPANSRLNTQHFKNTFKFDLPCWQDSLSHVLKQIL